LHRELGIQFHALLLLANVLEKHRKINYFFLLVLGASLLTFLPQNANQRLLELIKFVQVLNFVSWLDDVDQHDRLAKIIAGCLEILRIQRSLHHLDTGVQLTQISHKLQTLGRFCFLRLQGIYLCVEH